MLSSRNSLNVRFRTPPQAGRDSGGGPLSFRWTRAESITKPVSGPAGVKPSPNRAVLEKASSGKTRSMFKRSKTDKIKKNAASVSELALQLAQDKKFRKRLLSAAKHSSKAGRRTRRGMG